MKKFLRDWQLCGYHNYTPILEKSMETGVRLRSVTPVLPAKVPGSVYEPLIEAGLLPDPCFELNSRQCEWVAARFWIYETEFETEPVPGSRCRLVFEGIDCRCDIHLNGRKIASSDNMYVPVIRDITARLRRGKNQLKVLLYAAPDEMGQCGYTSRVTTQKARYTYKWDFCPRMPSLGIWRPVWLEWGETFFAEEDFRSGLPEGEDFSYAFRCEGRKEGLTAEISLTEGDRIVWSAVREVPADGRLQVAGSLPGAKLWQCNGRGTPFLYDLRCSLFRNGVVVCSKEQKVGLKKLRVLPNEKAGQGAPPYLFELNGEKLYIKGVNFAPQDMLYGRITAERAEQDVRTMKEMNVNMVRVWGGGFIESEAFYDACDRAGILVWQDFIQSSSGIDNHPSKSLRFRKKFLNTVRAAVYEKRNHVCTAVFCGGNEIAIGPERKPIDEQDPLIGETGAFVRANSNVHFVSTTPCGARFAADLDHPQDNHDIHAPWLYLGTEGQYQYGNRLECLFNSEFGVNGMCERASLESFLSPANIRPCSFEENDVWRHHGEMWDTYARDSAIFGSPQSIEDMIEASQFIQAEGLKYLVESNRRRAFHNGGVLIWCMNEPFPNVANLSIVDYYSRRKTAFYQLRRCYDHSYASLIYEKLTYRPGEICKIRPYVICGETGPYRLNMVLTCDGQELERFQMSGIGEAEHCVCLNQLSLSIPKGKALQWDFSLTTGGQTFENRVLLFILDEKGFADLQTAKDFNRYLRGSVKK